MHKYNVYKRKDRRYEIRVSLDKDENGKRKYKSFYGKTPEEAKYKLKFALQNIERTSEITELTVKEVSYEWLRIILSRVKESTLANYKMKIEKHIIPIFGDFKCYELKTKDVYNFIDEKKKNLSIRYISDILVLLKSIFKYASREYNFKNPLDNLVMPKIEKTEVKILSKPEQIKLEKYLKNNNSLTSLAIKLSLYMGLRIGEICALKWADIDFKKRKITVSKTIQRVQCQNENQKAKLVITKPKTKNSIREIPIPKCLIDDLRKFKNSENFYVISVKIKPIEPRTLQYRFVKILKNVNLPSIHFHSLCHLFATNCISLGFDVKTLSEILGHSSVEITLNRYVHSSIDRKRTCMNLLKPAA